MKWLTSDNKMLGYELMKAYPNISCFSTTRHGGCSKGNYTSFIVTDIAGTRQKIEPQPGIAA